MKRTSFNGIHKEPTYAEKGLHSATSEGLTKLRGVFRYVDVEGESVPHDERRIGEVGLQLLRHVVGLVREDSAVGRDVGAAQKNDVSARINDVSCVKLFMFWVAL